MNALKNHTEINSNRNLIFGIHLGGTQKDAQCAEATYKSHADLFAKGPIQFLSPQEKVIGSIARDKTNPLNSF